MVRRRGRRLNAIEGTVTVIATICFLPCICVIGGGIIAEDLFKKARKYERPKTRWLRECKERKKKMMRTTPKTVGPRLERYLTIGRPEPEEKEEEADLTDKREVEIVKLSRIPTITNTQKESAIFQLPLEIRRKIYGDVLGGNVIHIYFVEAYRRMSHTRCKDRTPEVCRRTSCRQNIKVEGACDEWGNVGLLPLLQSCRRIYSEAIEVLYRENTFDFDSLNDVLKLSLTLIPERMRMINIVQWKPTVASFNYLHNTPWLDCSRPQRCCCTSCWPEAIGLEQPHVNRYQYSTFQYPLPKSGWRICVESYP